MGGLQGYLARWLVGADFGSLAEPPAAGLHLPPPLRSQADQGTSSSGSRGAGGPSTSSSSKSSSSKDDDIPMLRGAKGPAGLGAKAIPDFLRVEPDEQEKRYNAFKQELVEKLKPTPETIGDITKDPTLLAGAGVVVGACGCVWVGNVSVCVVVGVGGSVRVRIGGKRRARLHGCRKGGDEALCGPV